MFLTYAEEENDIEVIDPLCAPSNKLDAVLSSLMISMLLSSLFFVYILWHKDMNGDFAIAWWSWLQHLLAKDFCNSYKKSRDALITDR